MIHFLIMCQTINWTPQRPNSNISYCFNISRLLSINISLGEFQKVVTLTDSVSRKLSSKIQILMNSYGKIYITIITTIALILLNIEQTREKVFKTALNSKNELTRVFQNFQLTFYNSSIIYNNYVRFQLHKSSTKISKGGTQG